MAKKTVKPKRTRVTEAPAKKTKGKQKDAGVRLGPPGLPGASATSGASNG